jgi:arylsulfatase A-like enzyme
MCGELIELIDFMGTAAAVVGETLPDDAGEDSLNLLPILSGEPKECPIREYAIHHSLQGMFSIRDQEWKYVEGKGSGGFGWSRERAEESDAGPEGQLYYIREDIGEKNNLYAEHPEMVEQLAKKLEQSRTQNHTRPMNPYGSTL